MSDYTRAKYWKCALQVNPASYINYRGGDHGMKEDEYNRELLKICLEENIKVLGIADHGNVDGVDVIRTLMNENNIVVFPGFEISSSEKAHFVCLFSEAATKDELNRFLGALQLTDIQDGIRPTTLSAEELLKKVDELGGVAYAAHCMDDSGVLQKMLNHVWKNPLLKAAQIPGTLDELRNDDGNAYRQILLNKDPNYKREHSIAILNAKDVERPETLKDPKASCLIKMSKPCFDSFKQAFLDPESRVRLVSDVPEEFFSRIEKVSFTGGYLDGVVIEFSEHLNAVIGGRGTGKSTLLECIRYGLELRPTGKNAQKQHDEIIKENLGKEKGRIEITIRSSKMNGKRFTVSRKYGEGAYVKDESGSISSFTPPDLLPRIEIYGQNEIYEIAQDKRGQLNLLRRFLDSDNGQMENKLTEIKAKLRKNRSDVINANEKLAEIEDEVSKLPKLQEQVGQFKDLGLEEKLKVIPLFEKEKQMARRAATEIRELSDSLWAFKEQFPHTIFLSDKALEGLPHTETLKNIRTAMDRLNDDLSPLFTQLEAKIKEADSSIKKAQDQLLASISTEEEALAKAFKEIPACEGRSGKEIGNQFKSLLQEIERIRPKRALLKDRKSVLDALKKNRQKLLADISEVRSKHSAQLQRALKGLNRKLDKKLKLIIAPEANRRPLMDFLVQCDLEGVGAKRLAWIESVEDFSPVKLAELIREGSESLKNAGLGMTPTVADALTKLKISEVMEIEELDLPDTITIELNIAHQGAENYRPLDKLSTGQQCTAILHMLLLENRDPLIMDQPEDNLDNAFIADRIVTELRSAKIARQFLFATHNANIPVFGDAEWIGVFEVDEGHGVLPAESQGAIDLPMIRKKASEILEGGKTAFIQRKDKYGF
jgi:ABC-type lipoprotein export system ATPase subunit